METFYEITLMAPTSSHFSSSFYNIAGTEADIKFCISKVLLCLKETTAIWRPRVARTG